MPRRRRVLAAKAGTVIAIGSALAVVNLAVALAVGLSTGAVQLSMLNGDVRLHMLGLVLAYPLYGALGVGIGALFIHQPVAVVLPLAWLLLEHGLADNLPRTARPWSLSAVTSALANAGNVEAVLPVLAGGLALLGYAAACAVTGRRPRAAPRHHVKLREDTKACTFDGADWQPGCRHSRSSWPPPVAPSPPCPWGHTGRAGPAAARPMAPTRRRPGGDARGGWSRRSRFVTASGTEVRDGNTPATADAQFRVASITKLFVATVVLQLVEEGQLGLDDPVAAYIPDFRHAAVSRSTAAQPHHGIPDFTRTEHFHEGLLNTET